MLYIFGGAKGIRTPDPHTASVVRYQLRYNPKQDILYHKKTENSRLKLKKHNFFNHKQILSY